MEGAPISLLRLPGTALSSASLPGTRGSMTGSIVMGSCILGALSGSDIYKGDPLDEPTPAALDGFRERRGAWKWKDSETRRMAAIAIKSRKNLQAAIFIFVTSQLPLSYYEPIFPPLWQRGRLSKVWSTSTSYLSHHITLQGQKSQQQLAAGNIAYPILDIGIPSPLIATYDL